MNKKVLAFGEVLLRMSPEMNLGWVKNSSIPIYIGGAELNTATALANWQIPAECLTALPNNPLSDEIIRAISQRNISSDKIIRSGERVGIYFLTQGADLKNSGVVYDRAHSSFSELKTERIDWSKVYEDVEWLHFSAISPALNQEIADLCLEALREAKKHNVKVSVDLNYRAKLWKYGKEPIDIMPQMAEYCDLIMGNLWAANKLLGISLDADIVKNNASKEEYILQAELVSKEILLKFKNCKSVANTFRFDFGSEGIAYYTTLFTENQLYVSPHFEKEKVIDKVGSGDCFMAGLIYGFYKNHKPQEIIDFAAAAAIGKLNELGDATKQKVEDINRILKTMFVND
jgi:2-dehydro-3-deoxygluconokinase